MKPIFLLPLLLLLTALIYLPGLSGGFQFDDLANLAVLERWMNGEVGWREVVFTNQSGPLGRSISMFSFLVNVAALDDSAWSFKLGNLSIHLVVGAVLFFFVRMLASRDRHLATHGQWLALSVTALWLLHPMMVSTVLYIVQRMAMLSALFMLSAMLAYLHGRIRLEAGDTRAGTAWLLLAVPLLTVLAALSKENGILAPILCGVLEWVYFAPKAGHRRPWQARLFIALGVLLPVVGAVLLLLIRPELFLAGYDNRPFDLVERVLTQGRVLFNYVGGLLLPVGSSFSLYRDDYIVSQGLITPWTTALSWFGWIAIAAFAWAARRSIPAFTAGIGIFIIGHAMESSIFPLLIYFEHRNYLPSIGLFIALAALLVVAGHWAADLMHRPKPIFVGATVLLLVALAAATHARSWVWQSNELLAQQSLENYPDSRFMRIAIGNIEMGKGPEGVAAAREHYRYLAESERASTRFVGQLAQLAVDCFSEEKTEMSKVESTFEIHVETIEADVEKAISSLADIARARECVNLAPARLAEGLSTWLDRSGLATDSGPIWRLRYQAARLYLASGETEKSLEEAERAWSSGNAELPVGMLIVGLNLRLGRRTEAEEMLDWLEPHLPTNDRTAQNLLLQYREALGEVESG